MTEAQRLREIIKEWSAADKEFSEKSESIDSLGYYAALQRFKAAKAALRACV